MKVYIKIKRNRNLRLHQPFNKRIGLMKRERIHRTLHHFSFGERFDETMMNIYHFGYQFIILSTHQFIGISPFNKSAGEATEVSIAIRRLAGRTSGLPTDNGKPTPLAKRKR